MLDEKEKKFALRLARETIRAFFENRAPKISPNVPSALMHKKGVFVTLTQNGQLRGCIGSLEGFETVWEEIQENALNAAFNDPRFPPMQAGELPSVRIEISILSEPKQLEFHSPKELLEKLEPKKHGVILQHGVRRATFLPTVWDELPEKESFLSHLCMKAGLEPTAWQDGKTLIWLYTAEVLEEKEN